MDDLDIEFLQVTAANILTDSNDELNVYLNGSDLCKALDSFINSLIVEAIANGADEDDINVYKMIVFPLLFSIGDTVNKYIKAFNSTQTLINTDQYLDI